MALNCNSGPNELLLGILTALVDLDVSGITVNGAGSAKGPLIDGSGTIVAGGVSQQIFAARPLRGYLNFQNVSDTRMWINFGSPATQGQPSYLIEPDGYFIMDGSFIDNETVNVICASAGKAFTCKQG